MFKIYSPRKRCNTTLIARKKF